MRCQSQYAPRAVQLETTSYITGAAGFPRPPEAMLGWSTCEVWDKPRPLSDPAHIIGALVGDETSSGGGFVGMGGFDPP